MGGFRRLWPGGHDHGDDEFHDDVSRMRSGCRAGTSAGQAFV